MKEIDPYLVSGNAKVFVLGKEKGKNWKTDFGKHFEVHNILKKENIKNVYIPDTSHFTGRLCSHEAFCDKSTVEGINVYNGCSAEGLLVPKNNAIFLLSADCPSIVYHDIENKILVAAHAGLGSVIDKTKILTDRQTRLNESIVHDILKHAHKPTKKCEIFIVCGISHKNFRYKTDDPIHGENNEIILNYLLKTYGQKTVPQGKTHGGISIPAIIKKQFCKCGIKEEYIHIDCIDTFSRTYKDPKDKHTKRVIHKYWSHARSLQTNEPEGRNGILILNT